jgi:FkbM family methyltransferase
MSYSPADLGGPYRTVFDVGAYKGEFAVACLEQWPECRVESFEPLLQGDIEGDLGKRWHWHQVALGNVCEIVEIHHCKSLASSSVLPMAELHEQAFPYTKGSELVRVGMVTLEEFIDLIEPPALLKIDVQGYELEVLKGAGEALDEFQAVVLEVSHAELYHGAPDPERIAIALRGHGFNHRARVDELWDPRKGKRQLLQSGRALVAVRIAMPGLDPYGPESPIDYSQSGEQAAILEAIAGMPVGRFLDIGAGDGETFSNTRSLALAGWGGVLVEPAAWAFDKLIDLYSHDGGMALVSACVTGGEEGLQTFLYSRDDHLSTTVPAEAAKWPQVHFKRAFAGSVSMGELLTTLCGEVTVASIDAEGRAAELVEAYKRHPAWDRLRVLCVEREGAMHRLWLPGEDWRVALESPNNLVCVR